MTILQLAESSRKCATEAQYRVHTEPRVAEIFAELAAGWISIMRRRIEEAAHE